jgi:uncharacterized linocin/CFP29 family protein
MRYLPREDAPFGANIWEKIDQTVVGAAKSQLAGRRLLTIVGPLGFGVRSVDRMERSTEGEQTFRGFTATTTYAPVLPVPMLRSEFALSIRDVAATEERGTPLDLANVALAAIAMARLEDALVFHGTAAIGVPGLMNAPGVNTVGVGDWSELGRPVADLVAAARALDDAGFPGPYTAALAPALYNELYRVYEHSPLTQLEHAGQVITGGLSKAPALEAGGVVLAVGAQFAHIIVAQDMTAAFTGPEETDYAFVIVESLVPKISVPEAVCVLGAGAAQQARRTRSR